MPFSTFAELQAAVASTRHRTGDTTFTDNVEDFISLCETEMQRKLKLVEFEASGDIEVTAGVGALPADFVGMRSLYWNGDTKHPMFPIAPGAFDAQRNATGDYPSFYYVTGSTIRVTQEATGTAVAVYNARFSALSDSNTSNSLLTTHPDAYLYGALKHACIWQEDDAGVQKYGILFNAACDQIKANNSDRKYAGPLQVRAR
jgi:hypothetical protein